MCVPHEHFHLVCFNTQGVCHQLRIGGDMALALGGSTTGDGDMVCIVPCDARRFPTLSARFDVERQTNAHAFALRASALLLCALLCVLKAFAGLCKRQSIVA